MSVNPVLLGIALFLLFLIPAFLYLFPHDHDPRPALEHHLLPDSPASAPESTAAKTANTSEPVLKVAALDSGLRATVNLSGGQSQVYLENTGPSALSHVELFGNGRTLGILSQLAPAEKKVLAAAGPVEEVRVSALDPSGREVEGAVIYRQPSVPVSLPSPQEVRLNTKSAPEIQGAFFDTASRPRTQEAIDSDLPEYAPTEAETPRISLNITTNKTEGREGELVGYRCTAVNSGSSELSQVKIFCAGKMASTTFLLPGKELHLDGAFEIRENTQLSAGVQGRDAQDRVATNNASVSIWRISPEMRLEVSGPQAVHRGDNITLSVRAENNGNSNLSDLTITDAFGEIGRIPLLSPGAFHILQTERTVVSSVADEVQARAWDSTGNEVYASGILNIRVLNSSLCIQGPGEEVRVYPGEAGEVTWILCNTGEEALQNVTLNGDGKSCILKELSPGKSVRMAAIYNKESTSWINVTAQGFDAGGYAVAAEGSVFLRTIEPGISLKVMPPNLQVCPGEAADISCLVTNTGDDTMTDIVLSQDGSTLASMEQLAPGDFQVVDSRTVIPSNCTLQFAVRGTDSRGQTWSDSANVTARVVVASLKVLARPSPVAVVPGNSSNISCTVANTGSIPLYNIFVISERFGPLDNIDFLAPKRQKTVYAEKVISEEIEDSITAEGFTQERKSVRGLCNLRIIALKLPGPKGKNIVPASSSLPQASGPRIIGANLGCGNLSMPLSLPAEEETASLASREIARDLDRSAARSNNQILEGISNLLRYVEKVLGRLNQESESSAAQELTPESDENLTASKNYELSIAGVRGSEHGAIRILDVSASPSQPAPWAPVKVTTHIKSNTGIRSAVVKWGTSELPLTKQDMLDVDRIYDSPLALESGDPRDGYWSGTVPGKEAGTYLVLSVQLADGEGTAEGGPYMLHWSTVTAAPRAESSRSAASGDAMLFIESTTVKGHGEVSIKDNIQGSTMRFSEKLKGKGEISLESIRTIDRKNADNFTEKKDLVWSGGQLKGHQTVESPNFHGGLGAAVSERFNLSHVDKSETYSVSSANFANNTLSFNTDQAFEGTWNIQTRYAKFGKKMKADQQYAGSFQTQKNIKFQDAGQN